MKHSLLLVAVVALVAFAAPAHSQYMYLDVDGNGINNASDILTPSSTSIDVYLDTNHDALGNLVTCAQVGALTMNSYEVILRVTGTLTYGAWTDNMSFATILGAGQAGNDFYVGRGSGTVLAPNLFKLGTVAISGVASGATVSIVSTTSAVAFSETAFGSQCIGNDADNTMKLGSDWTNVAGTYTSTPTTSTTWGHIKDLYK